jgi:hypothetical protein
MNKLINQCLRLTVQNRDGDSDSQRRFTDVLEVFRAVPARELQSTVR